MPPRIREPASAATAGTPTSTPPTTSPNPSPASATVSTPGRASTPSMPPEPARASGLGARTAGGQREPGRADDRGDRRHEEPDARPRRGGQQRRQAGPRMKNISMLIAS